MVDVQKKRKKNLFVLTILEKNNKILVYFGSLRFTIESKIFG